MINSIQHLVLIVCSWLATDLTRMTGCTSLKWLMCVGPGTVWELLVPPLSCSEWSLGQRQSIHTDNSLVGQGLQKENLSLRLMKIRRVIAWAHSSWLGVSWSKTLIITQIHSLQWPKLGWLLTTVLTNFSESCHSNCGRKGGDFLHFLHILSSSLASFMKPLKTPVMSDFMCPLG